MKRVLAACLLVVGAVVSSGCSQDVFSSETQFVCDSSADCAQGFECAQTATSDVPICVPASRVGDAGALCNDGDPPETFFEDADDDGFGDPKSTMEFCVPEDGWVEDASDCDDSDPTINPGAPEVCNGLDNDCDQRADIPAEGGSVCPRLIKSLSPGDISDYTAETGPDGSAYIAGSYRGEIELGDTTLTSQSSDAFAFELNPDGTIGWVSEVKTSGTVSFMPLATSSDYVALIVATNGALTLAGLDIPEFDEGFSSRVVVALLDRETGQGLVYEELTNPSIINATEMAFDSDGDLWVVLTTSGDVEVGEQTTLTLGSSQTAVPVEFEVGDDAITYVRHAEWLPDAEPSIIGDFKAGPTGAYIAGGTRPAGGAVFGHVAFFPTDGTPLDLDAESARVENLRLNEVEPLDNDDARLCSGFTNSAMVSNKTYVSNGGLDALLVDITRAGQLTLNGRTEASSEADVDCTYLTVLGDGSDVSVIDNPADEDVEVGNQMVTVPQDKQSELIMGRDSLGTIRWTRQLLASITLGVGEVAALGTRHFVVMGSTRGTLEVSGETVGNEDEPNGFLLIYENP